MAIDLIRIGRSRVGPAICIAATFVLMTRPHPGRELAWLQALMSQMGLSLHPDETRAVNARNERFDFLGYRAGLRREQPRLDASPRSRVRIHERLREPTKWGFLSFDELVAELKRTSAAPARASGWRRGGRCTIDRFMGLRMAKWWKRKIGLEYPSWSRVS